MAHRRGRKKMACPCWNLPYSTRNIRDPNVPYGKLSARQRLCSTRDHCREEMDFTFFISVHLRQLNSIIMSSGSIWSILLSLWQRGRIAYDFRKVTLNRCSACMCSSYDGDNNNKKKFKDEVYSQTYWERGVGED